VHLQASGKPTIAFSIKGLQSNPWNLQELETFSEGIK
jgi:hypothetical protein